MAAAKPNVLFVICDDLGFGDLACHGNPIVRTPHLDALHADSRRFTRYRSGPLCTPARAEVMTGKYHLRTGAIDTYLGRSDLRPGHRTLADHLGAAGYRTGCFGKWHLGDHAGCRPHERGFDVAVWHPSGGLGQPGDVPGNTYFDPQLLAPDTPRRCPGYCTDAITDAALEFIAEKSPDRPWFAYVGFNAPHTPLEIPDAWADRYRSSDLPEPFARLYAMIENIDANVGRLVDHLRTAGTLDDTLVVFTSDHGLQFTPD
ncbi:MAG: sulfatase-like hydrolase/transferase, partial [Planctomycetota bacterium]